MREFAKLFTQTDTLLTQLAPLWQLTAFECKDLPWQTQFPRLAEAVWQIADADIDSIDANSHQLLQVLLPSLKHDLINLDPVQAQSLISLLPMLALEWPADNMAVTSEHQDSDLLDIVSADTERLDTDLLDTGLLESKLASLVHFKAHIKGRKWQQISAFVKRCQPNGLQATLNLPSLPILEWCAGKGHLGRLIAKLQNVPVTSLEWQQSLCEQGQAFANQWQLPQQFICADAFTLSTEQGDCPIHAKQHAIALHACGDLHVRLLQLASSANTQVISISPCCYHLIQVSHYQPLSLQAKKSELVLSRHHLQIPLQQSVIANPAQTQLRHLEITWRLGFDSLQRDVRNIDSYLPVPTIKQSQLNTNFEAFCIWAADKKGLNLPKQIDYAKYLQLGTERKRLTQRLDLVSHIFRTAIENWLLLDRVCFLQEQGYEVTLSEFCPNSVTPRNAFIQAIKTVK